MKQSYSWGCVAGRGVDDDSLLEGARRIGYAGVEMIGRRLFDRAVDLGFELAAQVGHGSIESGLNDPANHDRIVHEVEANLELASRYPISKLIMLSGCRRPGLTDEEGLDHTVRGLERIASSAVDANVVLVLELLNSRVDHPGYQCDRAAWACRVIDAVGSPNVRVLYDIYHAQIMEGDLIRTIQSCGGHFGHYHTAGNPGRHELDENQEIAYPPVFRAIAATGYDGFVGHEFIPTGDPLAGLEQAYRLLDSSLSGCVVSQG